MFPDEAPSSAPRRSVLQTPRCTLPPTRRGSECKLGECLSLFLLISMLERWRWFRGESGQANVTGNVKRFDPASGDVHALGAGGLP